MNATFEDINELLTKAFWGHQHDINKTRAAFMNSQYAVTAFDGNKLKQFDNNDTVSNGFTQK